MTSITPGVPLMKCLIMIKYFPLFQMDKMRTGLTCIKCMTTDLSHTNTTNTANGKHLMVLHSQPLSRHKVLPPPLQIRRPTVNTQLQDNPYPTMVPSRFQCKNGTMICTQAAKRNMYILWKQNLIDFLNSK